MRRVEGFRNFLSGFARGKELHGQRGNHALIKTMTDICQPYLPLGDVVLPLPDPTPELVEQAMKRINFERIQTAMQAVGWTYWSESEAPSIETLRAMARGLLERWPRRSRTGSNFTAAGSGPAGTSRTRSS